MADDLTTLIAALRADIVSFKDKYGLSSEAIDKRLATLDTRTALLESGFKATLDEKFGKGAAVPKETWSWARFAHAVAHKDWGVAPFEKQECDKFRDAISKTMYASTFSGGGALIPPQYVAELIEFLRPQLVTQALGVRMLTGLTGSPVIIPKLSSGSTAYWIAPEGSSITASDMATGRLEMQPRKVAALVKVSNDLVTLSNPSVEASVRADITQTLAEEMDKQFFQGDGLAGKPVGLKNTVPAILAGDTAWTDNGTAAQATASLTAMLRELDENNALKGKVAWAMNPTSYWQVASITDTTGRSIVQPLNGANMQGGVQPTAILGYPSSRSTLVSSTTDKDIYLGNWDDAIIGMWSTIEVASSVETSTAFQNDELWIRAIARMDCGFRRNVSFITLSSVG